MRGKLKVLLMSLITAFSLGSVAVATLAWFVAERALPNIDINGTSKGAYFEYGDGTADKPFGIKTPRQLYNLAWLQYHGMFNRSSNNEINQQYHFELAGNIDMTGWELPPIGTQDNPFLGEFDGNSYTISNLTVSNKSTFSRKPSAIPYNVQPQIVGFFGVVGDGAKVINYTYDSSINTLHDFTLKNLTVESKTSETLIGLAAGYVNADMSGVKVDGNSTLDVNGQPSTAISSITSKLSDYGLVGYTTKTGSSGTYKQELSEYYANYKGESGEGSNWGGSINFKEFNARIKAQLSNANGVTYQQNPTNSQSSTSTSYQRMRSFSNDYLSATVYYGSNIMGNIVNKDPNTSRVIYNYMEPGTYTRSSYVDVTGIPGTVQPLITAHNDYYTPNADNTGYIVSGVANKNYSGSNYGMTIRTASYETRFIANALGDTTYATKNINSGTSNGKPGGTAITFPSYDKTKCEILTNSSTTYGANNYVFIKDELDGYNQSHTPNYNTYSKNNNTTPTALKLTKYNDSRQVLHGVLNGASYIHGLHFMPSTVTYNNTVTRNNIKLLGQTKNNYALPINAIDFNLKENGKINLFAGSYYSQGTSSNTTQYDADSDNFFSLYHIVRNGDSLVSTSVKKISVIFKNTDTSIDAKYVYQYSDNSNSSGTKGDRVFDMAYLNNCPVPNALYYFEIPVDQGEYALGAANNTSTSYGGYLMYLDIGASGEEDVLDKVDANAITTKKDANPYPIGVDFVPIATSGNGGETIAVSIASQKQGILILSVSTSNIAVTDTSSIAVYAYRNTTNYVESSPTTGQFTCNLSGAPPSVAAGGTRVLLIYLTTLSDDVYVARITDTLQANGTIASSTYELDSGQGFVTSSLSEIESKSNQISVSNLRALNKAATLTRSNGTGEFVTTYDREHCSYDDKIVDVDIERNGTSITIQVETGYTFKIDGTPYVNGSSYPSP